MAEVWSRLHHEVGTPRQRSGLILAFRKTYKKNGGVECAELKKKEVLRRGSFSVQYSGGRKTRYSELMRNKDTDVQFSALTTRAGLYSNLIEVISAKQRAKKLALERNENGGDESSSIE